MKTQSQSTARPPVRASHQLGGGDETLPVGEWRAFLWLWCAHVHDVSVFLRWETCACTCHVRKHMFGRRSDQSVLGVSGSRRGGGRAGGPGGPGGARALFLERKDRTEVASEVRKKARASCVCCFAVICCFAVSHFLRGWGARAPSQRPRSDDLDRACIVYIDVLDRLCVVW